MIDFAEIAVLDKNALYLGVPTINLMENAGAGVAKLVQKQQKNKANSTVIFCGLGNNGGDGLVAARHLAYDHNAHVRLYLLGSPSKIRTKIANEQFNRLQDRVEVIILDTKEKPGKKTLKAIDLSKFSVVVDAMLGVGISGQLREPYKSIVNLLNSYYKPTNGPGKQKKPSIKKGKSSNTARPTIISVDVPTGLGTDTTVRPHLTITFHDSKTGMTKQNSGKIIKHDIGIPKEAEQYVGPGDLTLIPQLRLDAHKGDRGRLLVIGGGPYTGAPALVGLSALRTGVDLVHIATPHRISNIIAGFSPNFIVHPLHQDGSILTDIDIEVILSLIAEVSATALVIGPGLGRRESTLSAIIEILQGIKKGTHKQIPILLDADAFSALATIVKQKKLTALLKGLHGVLTPHTGEFNRLIGSSPKQGNTKTNDLSKDIDDQSYKQRLLKQFALKNAPGWTLLLKGLIDIITDGKIMKLNRTGNAGMTVGGTGDVLAGITGGLLSMGMPPINAARSSAFICGTSGDHAWNKFGAGLMATDVIEFIPKCLKHNLE